jgi:hypothetical protein
MIYKGLQHVHLRIAKACIRGETLCYFLLGDPLEHVSYGGVTVDQSLPYELAQSDFVFCIREQFPRDERDIQEVLVHAAFRSQHFSDC